MVFNNNKGFSELLILIILALVVVGIVSVVVGNSFNQLNTMIQDDDDLGNTSKTIVNDLEQRYDDTMDGVFITMLGLFFIVGMLISWFSADNPYVMIIAIIMMIFLLVVGVVLSNMWEEYTTDTDLGNYVERLPITNYIMSNFLVYTLSLIGAMITVMYMRNR